MTDSEQLAYIEKMPGCEMFSEKLKAAGFFPVRAKEVEILQINTGRRCNLSCRHCHVEAGPSRKEMMSEETLWRCFEAIKKNPGINTADITGGAPEMNPHLERFLDEVSRLGKRTIVRSNLVILLEPEYSRFLDAYVRNRVEVVCSLPDFRKEKTDRQRGEGHFGKCLRVLGMLNKEGYGEPGSGLLLHLVHNPAGAYLPAPQKALEHEYRVRLSGEYGIKFNQMFCITNMPLGRYLDYLIITDNYGDYVASLGKNFNGSNLENIMCRDMISVGWDGTLYDCDFNQILGLPVSEESSARIGDFDPDKLGRRSVVIRNHCYGCTAGSGSSCQGCFN